MHICPISILHAYILVSFKHMDPSNPCRVPMFLTSAKHESIIMLLVCDCCWHCLPSLLRPFGNHTSPTLSSQTASNCAVPPQTVASRYPCGACKTLLSLRVRHSHRFRSRMCNSGTQCWPNQCLKVSVSNHDDQSICFRAGGDCSAYLRISCCRSSLQ